MMKRSVIKFFSLFILTTLLAVMNFNFVFGAGAVPFRYEITDLGTLGGGTSVALDINEQGQVVGGADIPGGDRHAYIWDNGVMADISGNSAEAWGINNQSQVVGTISSTGNLVLFPKRFYDFFRFAC